MLKKMESATGKLEIKLSTVVYTQKITQRIGFVSMKIKLVGEQRVHLESIRQTRSHRDRQSTVSRRAWSVAKIRESIES